MAEIDKPVTEEAKRFKEFRKAEGLTQKEFGEKLNKDQATIQRYEKGVFSIPIEIVKQLHESFDMSFNWFYLGSGSRKYVPEKNTLVKDLKTFETVQNILVTEVEGLKREFLKLHNQFHEAMSKKALK